MNPEEKARVEGQLAKILASKQFARSPVTKKFLSLIVTETLSGRGDSLKQYRIGQEVFGKGQDFDTAYDRIVSQGAGELRKKLAEYYQQPGRSDRCIITVPTGGFVPAFEFLPEAVPAAVEKDAPTGRARHRWKWGLGSNRRLQPAVGVGGGILAIAVVIWVLLANQTSALRITTPADGKVVGTFTEVTVKGWRPGLNEYLIVEPIDNSGQRWVQFKIEGPNWTRTARFGQADTPSGTRFRLYVLSTKSELPIDELKIEPEALTESPGITVTLQK